MAETVVSDLVTKFSFQGNTEPLNSYNASLGKGIGLLAGMTAALAGSVFALSKWTEATNQAIDANTQLSRVTGESIEFIQEMGFAASVNGAKAEDFNSAIRNLSAVIGEAALGVGRGKALFEQLGLSARDVNGDVKSAQDVFLELNQKFQDLSQVEKIGLARKLGINPALVQLMSKTGAEMDALRMKARELGIVTKQQADAIVDYNDAVTTQTAAMDGLKQQIAVGLAPQLQGMSEWITKLIVENREWIVDGIRAGIETISELGSVIKRISPILITLTGIFVGAKIAAFGLAGGFGVLLSPAVLIAAGIAALILVVDDLIVAFRGGDSVIANFFDGFDIDIRPMLKALVDDVIWMKDFIIDALSDMFLFVDKIFSAVGKIFGETSALIGVGDVNVNALGTVPTLYPGHNSTTNTTSNRSTSIEQNVSIDVRTDDPALASQVINDGLQQQLQDADLQSNRGGY